MLENKLRATGGGVGQYEDANMKTVVMPAKAGINIEEWNEPGLSPE